MGLLVRQLFQTPRKVSGVPTGSPLRFASGVPTGPIGLLSGVLPRTFVRCSHWVLGFSSGVLFGIMFVAGALKLTSSLCPTSP
eukprot:5954021-Amphidinium_carterae.1